MKNILLFIILLISSIISAQPQTKKVLFLGNSYTEVNNLPQIIGAAAASVGDVLIFDSYTPGGYKLIQHSTNSVSRAKIMSGSWDHVVMQGQSQEPIIQEGIFNTGAVNLTQLIKQYNSCSEPLFYMTWGRKNGDTQNCANIPVMCTYEAMDTALKNSYLSVATSLRAEIAPVSAVWKSLRQNHPTIELYQADESHPSAAGSYAAACCFYATIFKKDPALLTYNYNLSPADAAIIRNAAKAIVYDNLNLWDFKELPVSGFNYTIGTGNNEIILANTMQNADSYLWDFGDGTTSSTALNPSHSYANNGLYTITLTVSNCDLQGQHQSTYSKNVSFCAHTPSISPEPLTLCPQSSEMLWTQPADSYQWYESGLPVSGATNQYFLATSNATVYPSVMTTIDGCSELSRQSFVDVHHWMFYILTYNVIADGNIFDGNKACLGETITLDAQVNEPHLTQWFRNDIAIPSATNDILAVTETGTYKVRIDHPTCTNMSVFSDSMTEFPLYYEFIACPLAIEEFAPLSVSPNPAKNILILQTQETITKILIYDVLGKNIKVGELNNESIDISFLSQGIYFLKAKTKNNRNYIVKFMKE